MRRAATLVIFVFVLLLVTAVYLANALFVLERYAVVDALRGSAELLVHARGSPVPVEVGKLVRAGDVLITGPGSSVDLRWVGWAGGMRLKVGEKTRFRVVRAITDRSGKSEKSRLRIDGGKIWVRLRRPLSPGSKFEVETPSVVAAVQGTVFSISHATDSLTQVEVYEGEVRITREDGAAATLTTGSSSVVRPNRPGLEATPLSPEQKADWMTQVGIVGPFLEVTSPSDGVMVDESAVDVTGRAEPDSQVLVNGAAVTASQGAFSHRVALSEGLNTIAVAARDPEGRETIVVLTIPRRPAAR